MLLKHTAFKGTVCKQIDYKKGILPNLVKNKNGFHAELKQIFIN